MRREILFCEKLQADLGVWVFINYSVRMPACIIRLFDWMIFPGKTGMKKLAIIDCRGTRRRVPKVEQFE